MGSNNNSICNEHPGEDEVFQIIDNANGNKHIGPVFKNAAGYVAGIYSRNGTIQDAVITWSSDAFPAASGYYFGNDWHVYQDWMIQHSQCGAGKVSGYLSATTEYGVISKTHPLTAGAKLQNLEACDGSDAIDWAVIQP